MDFESVKAWLDLNISIRKQLAEAQELNNNISLCTLNRENTVHVFEGIELIADALGFELLADEKWEDDDHPYFYYFMYGEFKVFQLSRERLV